MEEMLRSLQEEREKYMKSATQPKCEVFFDSSAQFAGVFSATEGARLIAWYREHWLKARIEQ